MLTDVRTLISKLQGTAIHLVCIDTNHLKKPAVYIVLSVI